MKMIGHLRVFAKPITSKILFWAIALILIASLGVVPAKAQATTVILNDRFPADFFFFFVPCAANGSGEAISNFTGSFHQVLFTMIDDQGGFHIEFHVQPQGVVGIGETTGYKYRATGETVVTFNGKVGSETTFVDNVKIIGPGPGNNFLVHETFHINVNSNGETTVFVDHISIECK